MALNITSTTDRVIRVLGVAGQQHVDYMKVIKSLAVIEGKADDYAVDWLGDETAQIQTDLNLYFDTPFFNQAQELAQAITDEAISQQVAQARLSKLGRQVDPTSNTARLERAIVLHLQNRVAGMTDQTSAFYKKVAAKAPQTQMAQALLRSAMGR